MPSDIIFSIFLFDSQTKYRCNPGLKPEVFLPRIRFCEVITQKLIAL